MEENEERESEIDHVNKATYGHYEPQRFWEHCQHCDEYQHIAAKWMKHNCSFAVHLCRSTDKATEHLQYAIQQQESASKSTVDIDAIRVARVTYMRCQNLTDGKSRGDRLSKERTSWLLGCTASSDVFRRTKSRSRSSSVRTLVIPAWCAGDCGRNIWQICRAQKNIFAEIVDSKHYCFTVDRV